MTKAYYSLHNKDHIIVLIKKEADMKTLEMFDLTGKRCLITGSSRGIGFALARGLAGAGAEVILNGRNPATIKKGVRSLKG